MAHVSRRKFLKTFIRRTGFILAAGFTSTPGVFAASLEKVKLNVGYLPIADHLILPVSHAIDNSSYNHININPCLCKSWDEILGKVDMGILDAAFMLAPLAMQRVITGLPMKCLLLGHTNGSVIAVKKSITSYKELKNKTIGIPHTKSTHRLLLYKYLKDRNMEKSINIKLVKVPPPLTIERLKVGEIDGYCVAEPWGIRGIAEGEANILESSKNIMPDHACCIVMVKNRIIEKKPEAMAEWIKSLMSAGRLIHNDSRRASLLQQPYMAHKPADIAQIIKKNLISYNDIRPDRKKLDTISNLSLECGILQEKYNFDQLIDNRFV